MMNDAENNQNVQEKGREARDITFDIGKKGGRKQTPGKKSYHCDFIISIEALVL